MLAGTDELVTQMLKHNRDLLPLNPQLAEPAIHGLEQALPVLESFVGAPLLSPHIRMWYGFRLGSSGGGGSLYMEDQGTYQARRTGDVGPYTAIVDHELAHSFIGHESLTQFLELYLYNLSRAGSIDVGSWIHTRGYMPDQEGNTGVHAILDIYRIIGPACGRGRQGRSDRPLSTGRRARRARLSGG